MDLLIRFKPWHLFFLLLIPIMFSWFSTFAGIWDSVFFVFYTSWTYAIGIKMNALLPEASRPGTTSFKIHFWLLVGFTLFALNILLYIQLPTISEGYNLLFQLILILIYFYLLFNVWMFAARMLESHFQKGIANRSDSLKAFFCFWFFPFGIWHIQPAVQKVLAKYEAPEASTDLPA
ncbi:hypothetical protein [Mucilaginibacter sp.]|uniref:hypothetical protein n=3 Tax=Mucilaginibacter sp. TaxID=1882438 RepID=UPI0025DE22F8|nr:hypothetical protein [Mucilaginibacter sp.]